MKKYQLTVTTREGTGRSASRRLRKAEKSRPSSTASTRNPRLWPSNAPEFVKLLKEIAGRAALIELKRDAGATALSFLQEIQRDPITDRYLHVDLQEVKENEKMVISVTVRVTGEAYGVKTEGGILDTATKRLRIRTLPKDLPDFIEVNVTDLKMGEAIHISELKPIAGVEYLDDPGQTVSSASSRRRKKSWSPRPPRAKAPRLLPVPKVLPPRLPVPPPLLRPAMPRPVPPRPAKGDAKAAAPAAGAKPAAPARNNLCSRSARPRGGPFCTLFFESCPSR